MVRDTNTVCIRSGRGNMIGTRVRSLAGSVRAQNIIHTTFRAPSTFPLGTARAQEQSSARWAQGGAGVGYGR